MTNKNAALIAAVALALTAPAFANNQNSGVGNTINDNSSAVTATGGASTSSATGGSASSSVRNNVSSVNVNSNSARQHQAQQQSADNNGNAQSMTQNYEAQKRAPVSTAFAAPLIAADDTCMGSASAGGQFVGTGLSFGKTYQDPDCVRRKDARELHNMGFHSAAVALMCQNENVAAAMQTAGTPCPGKVGKASFHESRHEDRPDHVSSNRAAEGVTHQYPGVPVRFN